MRSPTRLDAAMRSRSPSTRGRGVQLPPERRRSPSSVRRLATIKLDSFDGNSVPLSTHLAKLDNCSHYYGWSSTERLCHLKASLTGDAASLLWSLPASCSEGSCCDCSEIVLANLSRSSGFVPNCEVEEDSVISYNTI
jgi:hypothetical protein